MEAIKSQIKELMVNQQHILEAIKFLKDKVEDDTKLTDKMKEIQDIIDSQEVIDEVIVKSVDDIEIIKRSKEEANMALKSIEVKITRIEKEMEILTKKAEDNVKNDKLEKSSDKVDENVKNDNTKIVQCNLCNSLLNGQTNLKVHMKKEHQRKRKCDQCDMTFELNIQLEKHLNNSHKKEKVFKCNFCEKTFHLEWRLQKHTTGHTSPSKFCHYFNNNVQCPYEENGCMFVHSESPPCKFQDSCSNQLCPFTHVNDSNVEGNENNDGENDTNVTNVTDKQSFCASTPKKRKYACGDCANKSQCVDCFVNQTLKKKHRVQFSEENLQINLDNPRQGAAGRC